MQRVVNSLELGAQPASRVKLAIRGKWLGHPECPGGEIISDDCLRSIVEQFQRDYAPNGTGLVVDFNHATLLVGRGLCRPDEAIAAGWIRNVALEDGELWGDVTWTANAEAKIRAGEFRYLSPVFEFDVPDRVTGQPVPCRLHSVALTNKPFLTELPAVANAADAIVSLYRPPHMKASAFAGFAVGWLMQGAQPIAAANPYPHEYACRVADPDEFEEFRRKELTRGIAIILGKRKGTDKWDIQAYRFDAEKFSPEQARKWLEEHNIKGKLEPATQEATNVDVKELAKLLGLAETATEEEAKAKIAELAKPPAPPPLVAANVAELLGVPADADLEAVKAAIEKLKAKPGAETPADPGFEHVAVANALGFEGSASLDDLLKKIGELKGAVINSDAELLVGRAVAEGKIPPADKARWIEEAKKDAKRVEALIANMAPLVRRLPAAAPGDDGPELTEAEIQVARQLGLGPDKLRRAKRTA